MGWKVQGMNKRSRKVWRMTVFFLFFGAFSVIAIFSTRWRYLSGQRLKETHQVLLGMVNFSLLDFIDDLNIRCFLYRFFFSVSLLFLLYTSSAHGIRLFFSMDRLIYLYLPIQKEKEILLFLKFSQQLSGAWVISFLSLS